jgi:hypothetical protein
MNNETAKLILSAYRPDGADAQDPVFADALEQARRDPQLGQWFEEQRTFDQSIFQELKRIEAPSSASDFLLRRIQAAQPRNGSRPWIPWLALAAVLVIIGVVLVGPLGMNRSDGNTVAAFQRDALAMLSVQPGPRLDLATSSLPETQVYIAKEKGPLAPTLPPALWGVNTAGCRVTEWHNHRISLTCFQVPGGQLIHLIVLSKNALDNDRLPSAFQTTDGWWVAYRERDGMVMFWATRAPIEEFRRILQS